MGSKRDPGQFDCYANALPDEPMFILLGRDPYAPWLLEEWAGEREVQIENGRRPLADIAMVEEARQCAENMRAWRAANDGKWRNVTPAPDSAAPISPMQVQHAIAAWNRLPEGARVEDRMKAALETLHDPSVDRSDAAYQAAQEILATSPSPSALTEAMADYFPRLRKTLTRAAGIIVEFGDLNGFRNCSDQELGRLVISVAEECGHLLNETEHLASALSPKGWR